MKIDEDLELTCGVCLEQCIVHMIGKHHCVVKRGSKALQLFKPRQTFYPSTSDGKSVFVFDHQRKAVITVLWDQMLKILQNGKTQDVSQVQPKQHLPKSHSISSTKLVKQAQQQHSPKSSSILDKKSVNKIELQQSLTSIAFMDQPETSSASAHFLSHEVSQVQSKQHLPKSHPILSTKLVKQAQQQQHSPKSSSILDKKSVNKIELQQSLKSIAFMDQPETSSASAHFFSHDDEIDDMSVDNEPRRNCFNPQKKLPQENSTDDINELLISAVEDRRPLWDHRLHPAKRARKIQNELWQEIADTPGIKGKLNTVEAKSKWKNLFDLYSKMIQTENFELHKSGSGVKHKKPKWIYYDIMDFTRDRCLVTETVSNRVRNTSPASEDSDEENLKPIEKKPSKDHRYKDKKGTDDSAISVLKQIAEKLTSEDVQFPIMPEQDDVDRAMTLVASNCRQVYGIRRRQFLRKIVNESYDLSMQQENDFID